MEQRIERANEVAARNELADHDRSHMACATCNQNHSRHDS